MTSPITRVRACGAVLVVALAALSFSACGGDGGAEVPPTTRTENSRPSGAMDPSTPNPQTPPQSGNAP